MADPNPFDSLKDKTVLVTGGARGIGKGIARTCLGEGARVIITNLNADVGAATAAELSSLGEIRSVVCDGTDRAAVDALVEDIWSNEGHLDLVFSNAGRGGSERVLQASEQDIHDIFATNFESSVNIARSCVPRMLEAGSPAHIMFTGSEHSVGLPAGNEALGFAFYGATKHALLIMAEWLRSDLRGTNVSVSLLLPGPVLTEGVAAAFAQLDEDPDHPVIRQQFSPEVERLLRERIITTDECAAVALRGLRAGLFYIPAQAYIRTDIDRRYQEMAEAFEALGLSGK